MNKKAIKLFKNPGIFFRDYFIKKYPVINSEQKITQHDEAAVYFVQQHLCDIEQHLDVKAYDVDVVYTWVNDKDPNWLSKKEKYTHDSIVCAAAADQARFENHNELYYSILSVKKFLPWVRNIYIVTDHQRPDWLIDDENIFIVDHQDIIDSQYLPTFNSHVIEAHLHRIRGLADHFIYFNDDVMVAKPLDKEHFFRKNGVASVFSSKKSLKEMTAKGISTATLSASKNSNQILMKKYGTYIDAPLVHTYVPLTKKSFEECWNENFEYIQSFLCNKFRSNNDLNMATFLVPWSMYLNAQSVISSDICYYFNIRSNHALNQYHKLLHGKKCGILPHSFCVNDFKTEQSNVENFSKNLENFLSQYYL